MGYYVILLLFLLSFSSWGWFSSPSSDSSSTNQRHYDTGNSDINYKPAGAIVTEFSREGFNYPKPGELAEYEKTKLGGANPCWLKAYQNLFASCSDIFAAEEKRKRLAWDLSACFHLDTGRPPFPSCNYNDKSSSSSFMVDCLRKLSKDEHATYLEFYLQTETICYQSRSKAFKFQVKALVNDLKASAELANDKLTTIEEKYDHLLHSATQIKDSLKSVGIQTQQVKGIATSQTEILGGQREIKENMLKYIRVVLQHTRVLYKQANGIAASQREILGGQHDLGMEIEVLQDKAVEVEKEISRFGEAILMRMDNLQGKANEIATVAGISLDTLERVLDGQRKVLEGLHSMTKFQTQALKESRSTLHQLLQFANGREKLMKQEEELLQAHDKNFRSMLKAQEAFESKQASMFASLDKLLKLHNALLVESRLAKAIFIYFLLLFAIYTLTSAKQTCSVRLRLFMALLASFFLELAMLWWTDSLAENKWLKHSFVRAVFVACAVVQLVYSYIKFKDYEALNYLMLETLMEKIRGVEEREGCYSGFDQDDDDDDDVDWVTWVDTELPEDVDDNEDPDYRIPEQTVKRLMDSTVTNTDGRYNLRYGL